MHNSKIVQINAYPTYRAPYMLNLEGRYKPTKRKIDWYRVLVYTFLLAFCIAFWGAVIWVITKVVTA